MKPNTGGEVRVTSVLHLKQQYVEIGILCDLAPPHSFWEGRTVINTNVMSVLTTNKTHYVLT